MFSEKKLKIRIFGNKKKIRRWEWKAAPTPAAQSPYLWFDKKIRFSKKQFKFWSTLFFEKIISSLNLALHGFSAADKIPHRIQRRQRGTPSNQNWIFKTLKKKWKLHNKIIFEFKKWWPGRWLSKAQMRPWRQSSSIFCCGFFTSIFE